MICPLLRASDLSAAGRVGWGGMVGREVDHALPAGGPGAIREVILRAMSGAISCMGQADVGAVLSASKALEKMVGRDRIEPPTPGFQV